MPVPFSRMCEFENQRLRMTFDGGYELVAFPLSAREDMDGSQHLICEQVESTNDAREFAGAEGATYRAEVELLVNIESAA